MRVLTGLVLSGVLLAAPAYAQDLDPLLDEAGVEGTLLVQRLSDGREWSANPGRAEQRFIPASTFKIPNSLIILETGVVADPDADSLEWDGEERWLDAWNQDQNLREGFARSAVWAYQEWARRVGPETMAGQVAALDYGNAEIGGPEDVDRFWLEGPLAISAREQVDFLKRLQARELPVSQDVQDTVVDIMQAEAGEGWVLRGKTGWRFDGEPDIGWHVGWLEAGAEVWFFALNIDMPDPDREVPLRTELTRAALIAAGAPIEG